MRYRVFDANGTLMNTIVSNESFVRNYCSAMGYTYALVYEQESEPEPTEQEDTDAMLVGHEYRLTLLELGVTDDAV